MATGGKKESGGTAIKVSIGKEIDRSLAEIISALLKPAATEMGSLLGNTIGLASDRIGIKRKQNAQAGLDAVRNKLESSGMEIKDIKPPKEEELHLLVNGLSLAEDVSLRDLWAGLFAKSLEPNSQVTAERPYLSILESLSPMDARVLALLAFVMKTDRSTQESFVRFTPKDLSNPTPEEQERGRLAREHNSDLQKRTSDAIREKIAHYELSTHPKKGWADNLMRLGVIDRTRKPSAFRSPPSAVGRVLTSEKHLLKMIQSLTSELEVQSRRLQLDKSTPETLYSDSFPLSGARFEVQLSAFGVRFVEACGLL